MQYDREEVFAEGSERVVDRDGNCCSPMSIYDFIGHEGVTVHTYFSYAADATHDTRDLETLLGLVHTGHLEVETAVRWSIADAAQAVQQLAAGGIQGKILLTTDTRRGD